MDTHPTEQEVSGDAVDQLPDTEPTDLSDAIDRALAGMELPADEPKPEADSAESEASEAEAPEAPEAPERDSDDPTDDLDTNLEGWTPKAADRFKELKAELKSRSSELEELRKFKIESERQMQELEALKNDSTIDELRNKLQEYENQRKYSDLESTEAYAKAITEPLQDIVARADAIADKHDIDKDALLDAISMGDEEKQTEILSELIDDERDRAKIYRMIDELHPLELRKQELYENAEAALAEARALEEKQMQQQLAERTRLRQNVARNVVERVRQKLPFLDGFEGLDLKAIEDSAAQADPSTTDPVDMAYNTVSAKLLPQMVRQFTALQKENESLLTQLAEYKDAEPTLSGGSSSSSSPSEMSDDLSVEERLARRLSGVV